MNPILSLLLNPRVLGAIALAAGIWLAYAWAYERGAGDVQARWDAAVAKAQAEQQAAAVSNAQQTIQVVTEYVEKKVFVDRPTVVDRLVRVCDDASPSGLPPPGFDSAAFAEAANRETLDALAGEITECVDDSDRFAALQRIVRAQCLN